jgi:hypothetical protein
MVTSLNRVGVREFREGLAQYLGSQVPVAITRHGQTVGYFVPTRLPPSEEDLQALRQAVTTIESFLAAHGISEDEVVSEFAALRKQR